MRTFAVRTSLLATLLAVSAVCALTGEAAAQTSPGPAPTLIPVSGRLLTAQGQPRTGTVLLVISLYEGQNDTAPRWIEHQQVTLDASGGYSVQFGGTRTEGLPADLFAGPTGTRWLGVAVENEPEQPRATLVSVPYAAVAASAETLGGRSAADFVLTSTFRDDLRTVLEEEGVTASAGTSAVSLNYLQKGDASNGTTDSVAYEAGGNIGIGTLAPRGKLDVNGSLFSSSFSTGSIDTTSLTSTGAVRWANNIAMSGRNAAGTAYIPVLKVNTLNNVEIGAGGGSGSNVAIFGDTQVSLAAGGATQVTLTGTGAAFAGNVVVNGNIGAKYQDVAEWVDSSEPLEAGTVVIIDRKATNRVLASTASYDGSVAGAVSPQPGLVLGEPGPGRVLVAQSGRVRIKADAKFGAIRPGDLLVTSPTKGHAMRSKPVKMAGHLVHRPGTVIGKALEALPSGQGEILVLLTLQ